MRALVVVFVVLGVEAVEDGSPEREDGGSPGQAVAPVKLVVHSQADRLNELDGKQDQAAHLEHRCKGNAKERRYGRMLHIKGTVQPKNRKIDIFPLFLFAIHPSIVFRCELSSLGDIGCRDVCLVCNAV